MNNKWNTLLAAAVVGIGIFVLPQAGLSCPRNTDALAIPGAEAATSTSLMTLAISKTGTFTATRTLNEDVPDTAVSCAVSLEGRYRRSLATFSRVETYKSKSSLAKRVSFVATKLPSVRSYSSRKQKIQPSIHVRVNTECVDINGNSVLSDTTAVVARYADCGSTRSDFTMATFIRQLKSRLK